MVLGNALKPKRAFMVITGNSKSGRPTNNDVIRLNKKLTSLAEIIGIRFLEKIVAVVVAQRVEWSLPIPEVCSSNQVIGKNLY